MKNSTSNIEINELINRLAANDKKLRIADYCTLAFVLNNNYSMKSSELKIEIEKLGYKSEGLSLNKTISSIIRYQNKGLFDKPRNSKFRLKKSIMNNLQKLLIYKILTRNGKC